MMVQGCVFESFSLWVLAIMQISHKCDCGIQVPFFSDDDEAPSTPKADALFVPRENPRALIIRPIDQWPKSSMKEACVLVHENGIEFLHLVRAKILIQRISW